MNLTATPNEYIRTLLVTFRKITHVVPRKARRPSWHPYSRAQNWNSQSPRSNLIKTPTRQLPNEASLFTYTEKQRR